MPARGEARAGVGDDRCCCRAKVHLLRVALFASLVNPALLRRRADQDLWARCSRVRLRLRMPYSSVCSGVLRVLAAGTGNSRSLRRLLSKQAPSKGPNLQSRIARFGYSSSGELPLKVGTGPLASEMLRFDIHKFSHFRQNCPQGYWVASARLIPSRLPCEERRVVSLLPVTGHNL